MTLPAALSLTFIYSAITGEIINLVVYAMCCAVLCFAFVVWASSTLEIEARKMATVVGWGDGLYMVVCTKCSPEVPNLGQANNRWRW